MYQVAFFICKAFILRSIHKLSVEKHLHFEATLSIN